MLNAISDFYVVLIGVKIQVIQIREFGKSALMSNLQDVGSEGLLLLVMRKYCTTSVIGRHFE